MSKRINKFNNSQTSESGDAPWGGEIWTREGGINLQLYQASKRGEGAQYRSVDIEMNVLDAQDLIEWLTNAVKEYHGEPWGDDEEE
jgi:hypothetical protein